MGESLDQRLKAICDRAARYVQADRIAEAEACLAEALRLALTEAGERTPAYAQVLRVQASFERDQGRFARSTELYERARSLLEQQPPEEQIPLAATYLSLARNYAEAGQPERAREFRHRARQLTRALIGRGDSAAVVLVAPLAEAAGADDRGGPAAITQAMADAAPEADVAARLYLLGDLARLHLGAGRRDAAAAAIDRALAAWDGRAPAAGVHPSLLCGLADLLRRLGRAEDALRVFGQARDLTEHGSDEPRGGWRSAARLGEGLALDDLGRAEEAEAALTEAARLAEAAHGPEDLRTVDARERLAGHYVDHRQFRKALEIYEEARAIKARHLPFADPGLGGTLNALGKCYDQLGSYTEAVHYYRLAYRSLSAGLGASDPQTIVALANLAELARIEGDLATAEARFREAMETELAAGGDDSELMTYLKNNLAEVLIAARRLDEAEPLLTSACTAREQRFGPQSEEYARSLAVLGQLDLHRGRYEPALEKLRRARDICRARGDPHAVAGLDFIIGQGLVATAGLPAALREMEAAAEELARCEDVPPGEISGQQMKLGWYHAIAGDWAAARCRLRTALDGEDAQLLELLGHGSRRNIREAVAESRRNFSLLVATLRHDPASTPDDVALAYHWLQRRKALETRSLRLQKTGSPSFIRLPEPVEATRAHAAVVADLTRLRRQLVRAELAGQGADVTRLRAEVEQQEGRLAELVPEWDRTWEVLRSGGSIAVPDGVLLIEYAVVDDGLDPRGGLNDPVPHYVAFLIGPKSPPQFFDLGPADDIDMGIEELRATLLYYAPSGPGGMPAWVRKGRFLYNRLVRPLLAQAEAAGASHVIVAPDGRLNTLPFEILPDAGGRLIGDAYLVSYLSLGEELRRSNDLVRLQGDPLIIAAPDYDRGAAPAATGEPPMPAGLGRRFQPLPCGAVEGEHVAAKIGGTLLQDGDATKAAVRACRSPEILHIASHSFYLERRTSGPAAVSPLETGIGARLQTRAGLEDPMERSGIALAGANAALDRDEAGAGDDGLLFGSEIIDLDLRATDLVTLSSCQSGLGDITVGDGTQGLRRAFKAAGCRSVVCSLWKVPDAATQELMRVFYDGLLEQRPRAQALHEARAALRRKYPDDPISWAGFVLDGAHGPLLRFNPTSQLEVAVVNWRELTERPPGPLGDLYREAMQTLGRGQVAAGIAQLTRVIDDRSTTDDLRAAALYERAGARRRSDDLRAARADYDRLLGMEGALAGLRTAALYDRGTTRIMIGDIDGAIADYSAVLASGSLEPAEQAKALVNRGFAHMVQDREASALRDFADVLAIPQAPGDQCYKALVNCGEIRRRRKQWKEAIAAFSDALALSESGAASDEQVAGLLVVRADAYLKVGKPDAAIADLDRMLRQGAGPGALRAHALLYRARARLAAGDHRGAQVDARSLLAMRGLPKGFAKEARRLLARRKSR